MGTFRASQNCHSFFSLSLSTPLLTSTFFNAPQPRTCILTNISPFCQTPLPPQPLIRPERRLGHRPPAPGVLERRHLLHDQHVDLPGDVGRVPGEQKAEEG